MCIGAQLSNADSIQVGLCSPIPKDGWAWHVIGAPFLKTNKNQTSKQSVINSPLDNFRSLWGKVLSLHNKGKLSSGLLTGPEISWHLASAPAQIQRQVNSQQLGPACLQDRDGQADFQDKKRETFRAILVQNVHGF